MLVRSSIIDKYRQLVVCNRNHLKNIDLKSGDPSTLLETLAGTAGMRRCMKLMLKCLWLLWYAKDQSFLHPSPL